MGASSERSKPTKRFTNVLNARMLHYVSLVSSSGDTSVIVSYVNMEERKNGRIVRTVKAKRR
jgi:hypothetical protein